MVYRDNNQNIAILDRRLIKLALGGNMDCDTTFNTGYYILFVFNISKFCHPKLDQDIARP